MNGKIKVLREDRGFGFLVAEDGQEHFFHRTACVTLFDNLVEGDRVTFDSEPSPKGPRATNISLIGALAKETQV